MGKIPVGLTLFVGNVKDIMLYNEAMKDKNGVLFVCSNCGNEFSKWQGQCPSCGEWNGLKEVKNWGGEKVKKGKRQIKEVKVFNLKNVKANSGKSKMVFSSKVSEFDRVLGKGFVQGSVILFSGEPGVGKSTLLTEVVGKIGGLYVAGEESVDQVALRVDRLGLKRDRFEVLQVNDIESIIDYLNRVNELPKIVVVDSIQVMRSEDLSVGAGSVSQIKECTFRLVEVAKKLGVVMIIVGHVTKEGNIAGPKLLEHMVDVVLYFEGDKKSELRFLRSIKNRFGSVDEIGVFEMKKEGLIEMRGDSLKLLTEKEEVPGSALTVLMEGKRPILVEVEVLVTESFSQMPKRVFSGVDYNRTLLIMAVAQKKLGIPFYKYDVFVSVAGGIKIKDREADLAILVAMYSSYKNKRMRSRNGKRQLWVGELSLLGKVKMLKNRSKIKKEAEAWGMELRQVERVVDIKKMIE
ncbi:DNA repair protein RadA [Candidatus Shapirobacteria bacterium]|nr:MAG: DNA repair protein RadA [Candidatus Shapirobacteria bacterium]